MRVAAFRCASVVAVLLMPGAIPRAGAQDAAPARATSALPAGVRLGDPVRVWSRELGRRSGKHAVLNAWDTDSLLLLPPGRWRRMETRLEPAPGAAPYAISRPSVTRLEVRVARTRSEAAWKFGLFGAATGVIDGLLLNALFNAMGGEGGYAFAAGVGGATGLAMGSLFGAAVPGGYWRRVP